jgi:hypothetical protein
MPAVVSLDEVFGASDLAIAATVEQIQTPRWNSSDGQDWSKEFETSSSYTTVPFQITEFAVRVEEVIYETEGFSAEPGDLLSVSVAGDPTITGEEERRETKLSTRAKWSLIDVGAQRVFFLQRTTIPTKEGRSPETWWTAPISRIWGISEGLGVPPAENFREVVTLNGAVRLGRDTEGDIYGFDFSTLSRLMG